MAWSDLKQLLAAILLIVSAVLPVINPLGDAPLFLEMTEGLDTPTRTNLARRVASYSFFLLFGSMLIGWLVLRVFELSVAVVQVGGGAVVCALGWQLLNQETVSRPAGVRPVNPSAIDVMGKALYPLTLPLTVDPGTISVAITVGVNHAQGVTDLVIRLIAVFVSCVLIAWVIGLTYKNAWLLDRWVGQKWMELVVRLSAFIVLCIGVQIVWTGARALLADSGLARPASIAQPARQ